MGFHKLLHITSLIGIVIIIITINVCLCSFPFLAESTKTYDPRSLDAIVLDHANEEITYPRTGTLYNVKLPANFSGIQVSIVRIITSTFWARGLNYSFVHFPPRIIPEPNVKRMAVIYSNFGNLSSQYFNIPNHTILPPVLGFMAFVSSNTTLIHPKKKKKKKMHLSILGDPITLRFPHPKGDNNNYDKLMCAKFDENGFKELSNMSGSYECEGPSQGHYALVVPNPMEMEFDVLRENGIWRKVGLGLGIVGMVLVVGLCFVCIVRVVKMRKMRKMEENSERSEAFDTFWVGESKMPAASLTRTRPALENDDDAPAQCLLILFPK